ncbi:kelch-like protein diablo [Anguilla rostrata]|uniref:kelch-like protein diablo n=1 Tax=Anguilla rostrata TaxID=7938 RepID=UPI0030D58DC8
MGVYNEQGEAVGERDTSVVLPVKSSGAHRPLGVRQRRSTVTHNGCPSKVPPKEQPVDMVYVVGGWSSDDPSCPVERFSAELNEWRMTAPMIRHRGDAAVCALGGLIYMAGGHDGVTCISNVEKYDPETNLWSGDVAPLSRPRSKVCLVEMEGYLYALGGHDDITCTNIVERYDPSQNTWMKLPPMRTRRSGAAAAVLAGYLYVMGGSNDDAPLNSVERYSPLDGCWATCPPMHTPRENPGCTVFLGQIYVAGGRDELLLELSTAERFDPENFHWSPVKCMKSKRHQVSLLVFNESLLAVGGSDGIINLKTMELYDHETNSWRHFGSTKSRHPGGHVVLMKTVPNIA